ncbi:hypothetical protein D3C85_1265570 [compost metagenome]
MDGEYPLSAFRRREERNTTNISNNIFTTVLYLARSHPLDLLIKLHNSLTILGHTTFYFRGACVPIGKVHLIIYVIHIHAIYKIQASDNVFHARRNTQDPGGTSPNIVKQRINKHLIAFNFREITACRFKGFFDILLINRERNLLDRLIVHRINFLLIFGYKMVLIKHQWNHRRDENQYGVKPK